MLSTLIANHHDYGPGWAGPWLLLLWLIPLAAGLALWRWGWGRRRPGCDAGATLADRYARGEIDEDEYRQRLAVLREKA